MSRASLPCSNAALTSGISGHAAVWDMSSLLSELIHLAQSAAVMPSA
jgi:hypothetical protein